MFEMENCQAVKTQRCRGPSYIKMMQGQPYVRQLSNKWLEA